MPICMGSRTARATVARCSGYFHGRSSLATWLRAVLAQRHVDGLRSRRRTEPLPDEGQNLVAAEPLSQVDPDRPRLVGLVQHALVTAIAGLPAKDRLRLRSYYGVELTLAQIGRITGEHEATVSRHLTRVRRHLREAVTGRLRETAHLNDVEIERAFELALEDPGALDVRRMFGKSGESG